MKLKKDTICVQGGWQPKNGEPRVLPIYQSTTFRYETSEEMGKLFDLEKEGYFYSRLQNPTCDIVAQKICDLEGGVAAMLTSSGQAATMLAVTNICEAGDHIICAAKIYGGTSNLLAVTLHRFGVEVDLVDQDLPEEERDQAALEAVEQEKAKKEIRRKDAEIDRRSKIAGVFCKAFEKAVLITPTEENVRIWAECTRMTPEELADTVQEARELSETFSTIADIMEQKILPTDWRNAASGDEPDSDDSERPKDGGDS